MKKTHYFGSILHCQKTSPKQIQLSTNRLKELVADTPQKALPFLRENRLIDQASAPILVQSSVKIDLAKEPQAPRSGEDKPQIEIKKAPILKLGRSFTLGHERPRSKTEAIRRKPQNTGPSLFQKVHSGLDQSTVKEACPFEMEENSGFEQLELVDFQPQNKVLVGERKLMKRGLMRANTMIAKSYTKVYGSSYNRSSAFQLCIPQSVASSKRESVLSVTNSEPPQDQSETKQRCRFALKYLHRLVAKLKPLRGEPRHHPSFMSSILNQSEFSQIEQLAFEQSRKSSDDQVLLSPSKMEDLIKETELWEDSIDQENTSIAIPAHLYKFISDELSQILAEEENKTRLSLNYCEPSFHIDLGNSAPLFSERVMTPRFSESEIEEVDEVLVLNFTRKFKHSINSNCHRCFAQVNWRAWYS